MKTSQSIEDYLEMIYLLKGEKGNARVGDIALRLGVSMPSVTETIRKLATKNLVSYESYGPVKLTPKGETVAKKVYAKHKLLTKFFILIGVDEKTALHDACLAEHVLSKKTIDKLKVFVKKKGE
jgi:DtxR family Mn-dependent transcriptional regulator